MADQVSNPETEPQADPVGVGSDGDGTTPAAEDAPMDPAADIEQLDDSLSAMTDLLLSSSEESDFDFDGDFAVAGDASAALVQQFDEHDAESDSAGESEVLDESPSDVVEQLEQVEAAVSAALDESGEEEAVADEPTATDETSEPDAATESLQAVAESLESGEEATAVDQAEPPEIADADQDSPPKTPESEAIVADDAEPVSEPAPDGPVDEAPASSPEPTAARDETPAADTATAPAEVAETPAPTPGEPEAAAAHQPAALPRDHPAGNSEPDPPKSNARDTPAKPKLTNPKPSAKDRIKAGILAIALPVGRVIMAKTGDLLARGTEPLALHLADQPKVMRQSLAWLALWTAFNAGAVWSYLLFFRAPVAEVNPAAMTHISGAESAQGAGLDGDTGGETQGLDPATTLLLNPIQK